MTKLKTNWAFLSLVTLISLSSFIYLNTVTIEQSTSETKIIKLYDEEEEDASSVSLPDLEVVKKILEGSKKILMVF